MTLGKLRMVNDVKKENQVLKTSLAILKRKFGEAINIIEDIEGYKNTGYYAFIGFKDGKPISMGIYHKDDDTEKIGSEILQQTQVVIPIPDPEHLKEFDGF